MDDVQNRRGFLALNFLQERSRLRKLPRLQTFPRGIARMTEGQGQEAEGEAHPGRGRRRGSLARAGEPLKEPCGSVCCIPTLPGAHGYRGCVPLFLFEPGVYLLFLRFPMECGSCRGR